MPDPWTDDDRYQDEYYVTTIKAFSSQTCIARREKPEYVICLLVEDGVFAQRLCDLLNKDP